LIPFRPNLGVHLDELDLITDMVEEQIAEGNLRWLANFQEIRRDFRIEDLKIPLYANGGLEEKGFLLSRLYSSWVTPKYKVHFLLITSNEIDEKFMRKLITTCKRRFEGDDWIFLELVQNKPIEKSVKNTVENLADPRVGVVVRSLSSKDEVSSNNVLGRGLKRQLTPTEAKFEVFDWPDYLKSFTIVFFFSTAMALTLQMAFRMPVFNFPALPVTVMILLILSIVTGRALYRSQYHLILFLTTRGFTLKKGKSVIDGKWADYNDLTIYINSKRETQIRLYGEKGTFDLPLSRIGISRKEAYSLIEHVLQKK